jgi:hypothetical protein
LREDLELGGWISIFEKVCHFALLNKGGSEGQKIYRRLLFKTTSQRIK